MNHIAIAGIQPNNKEGVEELTLPLPASPGELAQFAADNSIPIDMLDHLTVTGASPLSGEELAVRFAQMLEELDMADNTTLEWANRAAASTSRMLDHHRDIATAVIETEVYVEMDPMNTPGDFIRLENNIGNGIYTLIKENDPDAIAGRINEAFQTRQQVKAANITIMSMSDEYPEAQGRLVLQTGAEEPMPQAETEDKPSAKVRSLLQEIA